MNEQSTNLVKFLGARSGLSYILLSPSRPRALNLKLELDRAWSNPIIYSKKCIFLVLSVVLVKKKLDLALGNQARSSLSSGLIYFEPSLDQALLQSVSRFEPAKRDDDFRVKLTTFEDFCGR